MTEFVEFFYMNLWSIHLSTSQMLKNYLYKIIVRKKTIYLHFMVFNKVCQKQQVSLWISSGSVFYELTPPVPRPNAYATKLLFCIDVLSLFMLSGHPLVIWQEKYKYSSMKIQTQWTILVLDCLCSILYYANWSLFRGSSFNKSCLMGELWPVVTIKGWGSRWPWCNLSFTLFHLSL